MSSLRVAKKQKNLIKYFPYWKTVFPRMNTEPRRQKFLWNHPKVHCICGIPDDESESCIKAFITVWKFEDFALY